MTVTEEPTSTALVPTAAAVAPIRADAFIRPAAPVYEIAEAMKEYQELCHRLLDDSDYQTIGNKQFRKKSGYRKLAAAYNVSVEITDRAYERNEQGRIIRAEVVTRATAPNGRHMDGLGACDLFEKCCNPETCRNKSKWHDHCSKDCDGARHFSNPQHDLPATAHTRSVNRSCADLFAAGEVSAEEITNADHMQQQEQVRPRSFRERLAGLPDAAREVFPKWLASAEFPRVPKDWSPEQARVCERWLENAEAGTIETVYSDATTAPTADAGTDHPSEPAGSPEQADTAVTGEPDATDDANVAEEAGAVAVDEEVERVKNMKPAEVKAELEALGKPVEGTVDELRKRLTIALLKDRIAKKQAEG